MAGPKRTIITEFQAKTDQYEKGLKSMQKELGVIEDQTESFGKKSGEAGKKAGAAMDDVGGKASGLQSVMGDLQGNIIAAFSIGSVVAFTAKIIETQKEIESTTATVRKMTGTTGKELDKLTARLRAFTKVWNKDFNESLIAANGFAKQMGISFNKSLDLIEKGFKAGADVGGDFLSKLREYPVQFRNAGFTAEEFIKIATQEQKSGIYDDKLIDALKEADLALKEMTKTQKDALIPLGKEWSDILAKDLKNGAISTKDALFRIEERATELNLDFQTMQTITADVFKGAGEDAGGFTAVMKQLSIALDETNNILESTETGIDGLVVAQTRWEERVQDMAAPGGSVNTLQTVWYNFLTFMTGNTAEQIVLFGEMTGVLERNGEEVSESQRLYEEFSQSLQDNKEKERLKEEELKRAEAERAAQRADIHARYVEWSKKEKFLIDDMINAHLRQAMAESEALKIRQQERRDFDAVMASDQSDLFEEEKEVREVQNEELIEKHNQLQQGKKTAEQGYVDFAQQSMNNLLSFQISRNSMEVQNRIASLDREKLGEEGYAREVARINREAGIKNQKLAISQALMNAAVAGSKAIAQFPIFPAFVPFLAAIAAQTGVQIATIRAQKFNTGSKYVSRNGAPRGTDTIPAWLNEGESVIPTEQTRKHKAAISALVDNNFDKYINQTFVLPTLKAAIEKAEDVKNRSFAQNLSSSMMMNIKDGRILSALEKQMRHDDKNTDRLIHALRPAVANKKKLNG